MTGTLFDIIRCSFVDGPGIRTAVFFKGCNLNCAWCHNPESQSRTPQMMFYKDKCTGCGKCKEVCPHSMEKCDLCGKCALFCPVGARKVCGREYSADEVVREILKDVAYYENSGGGATFSGGECMLQADFLSEILKKCKENGINTAVDTAGNIPFESFEKVLPFTDLFLYDIKLADPEKHKKYTGADNALIVENLEKLFNAGAKIRIRVPVIPGVNDSEQDILAIKTLVNSLGTPEKIELLPYHTMGENKYLALGREYTHFSVPPKETLARLNRLFT